MKSQQEPQSAASLGMPRATSPNDGRWAWLSIGLLLFVLVTHWPVLQSTALCFDDDEYLTNNPLVSHPSWESAWRFLGEVGNPSSVHGYYQPLAMLSLMADYALGGRSDDLTVFHRTSLTLHAINSVLIFLLLRQLFGSTWPSALAAAFFGAHPVVVESVAWVSDRKTLLATMFTLFSLLAYVSAFNSRTGGRRRAVSWVLFLAALLSKPTTVPLPVLLLILEWWPLGKLGKASVARTLPFFGLSMVFGVITMISQSRSTVTEPEMIGSAVSAFLVIIHAIAFYLGKLIWPVDLCSCYLLPASLSLSNPTILAEFCIVSVLVGMLVLTRKLTRGLLAGFLFFLLAVFPTLGLVRFTTMATCDRYLYLPMLGMLLILAWALTKAWGSGTDRRNIRRFILAVVVAFLAIEVSMTRAQIGKWRDSETLFRHILKISPDAALAHNRLGNVLREGGRFEEATAHFREAIRIWPSHFPPRVNLGCSLLELQRYHEAGEELKVAVELRPADGQAQFQYGMALKGLGRTSEALAQFRRARELMPSLHDALLELGIAQMTMGQIDAAAESLRAFVKVGPGHAEGRNNYGGLLLTLGRAMEAIPHLQEAVRLKPDYAKARNNLGAALALEGRAEEAVSHLREAVRLDPAWPAPVGALAWILATHPDAAVRDAGDAIQLAEKADQFAKHRDARVIDTLAAAYANAGQYDRAILVMKEAAALAPAGPSSELAAAMRERMELYRQGRPYRDMSLAAPPPTQRR